ncbi:cell wall-binding repeat-containing protein [Buchananella hordeovulneris]|uniref:cell wall-binding repeat-containing protein n=1 Tax=Buchananella hordeovulneris TaxID=52770 RepID=UPI0026DAEAA1|nr:cell wall-binding repeat-containing protein [Buchananella hordeovulneris]MDO5081455.1 cell wall-binding repeat-containing protein [Buchananella hordeovulneris]
MRRLIAFLTVTLTMPAVTALALPPSAPAAAPAGNVVDSPTPPAVVETLLPIELPSTSPADPGATLRPLAAPAQDATFAVPLTCHTCVLAATWHGDGVQSARITVPGADPYELEIEETDSGLVGTEPYFVTGAASAELQLTPIPGGQVTDANIRVIDVDDAGQVDPVPAPEQSIAPLSGTNPAADLTTAAARPVIHTRAQWGANESWNDWGVDPIRVEGAVVHHTAGTNNYSAADVPGILRGIYHYHAVTLGWGDIGYNVLVDKYGNAWQGRRGDVYTVTSQGAHALGANDETFGISLLGDHSHLTPSPAALDAIADVLAFKLQQAGVAPRGTMQLTTRLGTSTVPTILPHRHVPSNATTCPGNGFMTKWEDLLNRVETKMRGPRVPAGLHIERLAGTSRIDTAVRLSQAFAQSEGTIYLASTTTFADALAAGSAAGHERGPVLLSDPATLSELVRGELRRLRPHQVVIVGGPGSLSETVVADVRATVPQARVHRVAGPNRYATAAALSAYAFPTTPAVFLANGQTFADALAVSAVAGASGAPVLLTDGQHLDATVRAELQRLAPQKVWIVGADAAVSPAVAAELAAVVPGAQVQRVAGPNRYATAAAVAKLMPNPSASRLVVSGQDYPDALAAAAAGAVWRAPLVLTGRDQLPPASVPPLSGATHVRIIGGPGAVSQAVAERLAGR